MKFGSAGFKAKSRLKPKNCPGTLMMGWLYVVVPKSVPALGMSAFVVEERGQDPRRGKRPPWHHPDCCCCDLACMTEFTLDPIMFCRCSITFHDFSKSYRLC